MKAFVPLGVSKMILPALTAVLLRYLPLCLMRMFATAGM
jgi:hypothetical protein